MAPGDAQAPRQWKSSRMDGLQGGQGGEKYLHPYFLTRLESFHTPQIKDIRDRAVCDTSAHHYIVFVRRGP